MTHFSELEQKVDPKMKVFVVIFLFAFLAGIHGDDFEELVLANDGVPDRHPYVVLMGRLLKVYVKSFLFFVFASDRKRYLFTLLF